MSHQASAAGPAMVDPVGEHVAGNPATRSEAGAETEAARAAQDLERLVQQAEVAAREWGIRPDHLEGRFVSALLATLTWLGRLIQAAAADLKMAAKENRMAAAADLDSLRKASATAVKLQEQAQTALAVTDVQVNKVVTRFVDSVSPQIVKQISEAVVLRERRHNQNVLWGRAAGIAFGAIGLVLGGYLWAAWTPDPMLAAGMGALERIRQCQAAPIKEARTGETFCVLKSLLAPA